MWHQASKAFNWVYVIALGINMHLHPQKKLFGICFFLILSFFLVFCCLDYFLSSYSHLVLEMYERGELTKFDEIRVDRRTIISDISYEEDIVSVCFLFFKFLFAIYFFFF
jgi:hypothetical protein